MSVEKTKAAKLKAAEWAALKVAGGKAAKECGELAPGQYDVDLVVRLVGKLTRGEDSETASTVTPEIELLIGHLIAQLPEAQQDQLLDHLHQLFEGNGQKMPCVEQAILDRVNRMLARVRTVKRSPRAGSISGLIDILPIDEPPSGRKKNSKRAA